MRTLLTMRSMTYAQKGQRLLERNWISAGVVRTPEKYAARGCSYGLVVKGDGEKAAELLRKNGIEVLGKYPYSKE
jgi:hypothetical protein